MLGIVEIGLTALYLLSMIAVGFMTTRWIRSGDDFFLAGREIPLWIILGGVAAMQLAGTTTSGYPEMGALYGWGTVWGAWGWSIGMTVYVLFITRFARRSGSFVPSEWVDAFYGSATRVVVGIVLLIGMFWGAMGQLIGSGAIFATWANITYSQGVFLIGLATLIYMVLGGFWAALVTDAIQFIIAAAIIYVVLPVFLVLHYGGYGFLQANLEAGMLNFPTGRMATFDWLWPSIGALVFFNIAYQLTGPYYWQRAASGRTEKASVRGWVLAILFILPYGVVLTLAGMYVRAAHGVEVLQAGRGVFGVLLSDMPVGLAALVMMGVLAATQSTANGLLLGAAAVLVRDILNPLGVGVDPRAQKRWGMIAIGVFSALSILAAAAYQQGALYALSMMSTYLIAIAPSLLGSFYWKDSTQTGALLSVLVAALVGTYWVFSPLSSNFIHPMWVTAALSTAIFVLVSLFINYVYPGRRLTTDYLKRTGTVPERDLDLNAAASAEATQTGIESRMELVYQLSKGIGFERQKIRLLRRFGNPNNPWVQAYEKVDE